MRELPAELGGSVLGLDDYVRLRDADGVEGIIAVNDDVGVRWVYSFLSADKRKTYCLYEAESKAAIIEAARRSDIPEGVIIRVDQVRPEALLAAR